MKTLENIMTVAAVSIAVFCSLTFVALIVLCAGAKLTGLIA